MRQVVLAGGNGLIGQELQKQLRLRSDVEVTVLVRRAGRVAPGANLKEYVFDFAADYPALGTSRLPCDVLICAVGSTMKQAGSQAGFLKIERDIPVKLLERMKAIGKGPFGFVSSTGAGKPVGFYLETKAAVERAIRESGVPSVIVRPSLLLGDRAEFRLGEIMATWITVPLMGALLAVTGRRIEALERLEPVEAAMVAKKLIAGTLDASPLGVVVLEGRALTG